ncbi:MAG: hypothetical protein K9H49_05130 [Bacteroidales bacterium]|nr:hypothetical protein [Bacteroidales bacterium]MCF8389876.1 hypothetical protein [Bacteroidales bacterium]
MMKFRIYLLSILFTAFMITGCEKDETTVNEAEVLVEYLESTDSPLMKDFVNTDMPTMITASDLNSLNLTNQAYIIDIRSAADFALGHIANAHNVALADILTHIEGVDLTPYTKVAIVCYTGQTAGFAASVLRLMGYDKVYDLKWGMCSWNDATASKWKTTIAAGNTYATQFTATAAPKAEAGSLPVLSTGFETGQDILEARAQAVLTEGFSAASISNATVFANKDDYYIVNYWSEAHYTDPGHIPGAIQYTPKESIKLDADLLTLPTDKPVVVYCYTGQTSAFLAAYLRMLGYDAKSLLYGANGMIYDVMLNKSMTTFKASDIMGYALVSK